MEFKNLDCNILYVLGEDCCRSGTIGPFEMCLIAIELSDIPVEDLTAELIAMDKNGLLILNAEDQKISLTSKGMAKIKLLYPCQQWGDQIKISV